MIAIRFNLPHIMILSFFYVPFLPPFNVLSSYFYVSLNLRWWFPKLYMINFVTELSLLLTNGILKRLWLQGLEK